jgi:hypothetical protein
VDQKRSALGGGGEKNIEFLFLNNSVDHIIPIS